ncbi:MAG: hypothetical protein IAG10_06425 [Planctomycetaceae bacterium]|nr:hypothetical protein [Planctomycetaceae bacterium]
MSTLFQFVWGPFCGILLASCGIIGLVALLSPKAFERIANFSGRWIDSNQILARLDKPIDVDSLVLPHSRKLGAAVLAAVSILAFRWCIP